MGKKTLLVTVYPNQVWTAETSGRFHNWLLDRFFRVYVETEATEAGNLTDVSANTEPKSKLAQPLTNKRRSK